MRTRTTTSETMAPIAPDWTLLSPESLDEEEAEEEDELDPSSISPLARISANRGLALDLVWVVSILFSHDIE